MTRDELEFAISQYLDGNLAEADESALESLLASDADARALLAEYRGLDRVLRSAPLPNDIDFDAFSGRIQAAVAAQDEPAQSYRLHWVRTAAALALAACVILAVSIGIRRLQAPTGPGGGIAQLPQRQPRQIVVIDTSPRLRPSTAPVAVVAVGPSPAPQDRAALARYHEDLISRPSQVIIARTSYPAQDGSLLPY